MKNNITMEQHEKIKELKIQMLVDKTIYELAKEEHEKAKETEKQAEQKALTIYNNKYNTNYNSSWEIGERKGNNEEFNEYLHILQDEFSKMGIKTEFNHSYSYDFLKNYVTTEKKYLLDSCEFLEICGKTEESNTIRKIINTYIPENFKQKLININDKFLIGEN